MNLGLRFVVGCWNVGIGVYSLWIWSQSLIRIEVLTSACESESISRFFFINIQTLSVRVTACFLFWFIVKYLGGGLTTCTWIQVEVTVFPFKLFISALGPIFRDRCPFYFLVYFLINLWLPQYAGRCIEPKRKWVIWLLLVQNACSRDIILHSNYKWNLRKILRYGE